jgi:aryl-alcohol dehydrogenase-like predicted oxidoreductase
MTLSTRPLGRTGIRVSEIGLGAWQLGGFREWDGPGEEGSIRLVHEALDIGCTFFDTAPPYADGRSEEYLGLALEGRRDEAVLCTKFGFWPPGYHNDYSAGRIEESVENSLRRLRTDHLDVLLMHGLPDDLMDARTTSPQHFTRMRRLVDEGVIRTYGVELGNRLDLDGLRMLVETAGVGCVELRFNPLSQSPAALFDYAEAQGVGLIASVPLEMGWLSGKYDATTTFPPDSSRSRLSRQEIARRASLVEEYTKLLPDGVSPAHGALRFILAHQQISTTIPGAKDLIQLRDNVAAASERLPPDAVEAIKDFGARRGFVLGE